MATTRRGAVLLMIGLTASLAQAAGDEDLKTELARCRHRLRELARSVGERLDEADASAARDAERRQRWAEQTAAVARIEMAHVEARLAVEVAEAAARQYEEGPFKQQLTTADGNIAIAEAEVRAAAKQAEDARKRLKEAKALVARISPMPRETASDVLAGYEAGRHLASAEGQVEGSKYGEQKAAFALEQARTQKDVLVRFTKEIQTRTLKAEVEKARSRALALQAELTMARDAEARLERAAKDGVGRGKLTQAERKAAETFAALGSSWREIIGRKADVEASDASRRDGLARLVADFDRALGEAERAWSSARQARLDDLAADVMRRAGRP